MSVPIISKVIKLVSILLYLECYAAYSSRAFDQRTAAHLGHHGSTVPIRTTSTSNLAAGTTNDFTGATPNPHSDLPLFWQSRTHYNANDGCSNPIYQVYGNVFGMCQVCLDCGFYGLNGTFNRSLKYLYGGSNNTDMVITVLHWLNNTECAGPITFNDTFSDAIDQCQQEFYQDIHGTNYSFYQSDTSPYEVLDSSTGRLEFLYFNDAETCLQSSKDPLLSPKFIWIESNPTNVCIDHDFFYTPNWYAAATKMTCTDESWTMSLYNSTSSCGGSDNPVETSYSGNVTSGCTASGYFPSNVAAGYVSFRCVPPKIPPKKKQNGSGHKSNGTLKRNLRV